MSNEVQTEPGGNAEAVTPSDETEIYSRGIYVGTGGDIAVEMLENAETVTFVSVAAGTLLPIKVSKVLETGTTAEDILRIW